ncbi:hypothetical protein Tco_0806196 [Tanacetum coccineum]
MVHRGKRKRSTDENPPNVIVSDANPARGGRKHARMADLVSTETEDYFEKHDWMIYVSVPGEPEEDAFEQDPFEKFDKRRSVLVQGEPEEDSFDYDPFVKFDKKRSVLVPGEPEEDSFDYDPFVKFDKRRRSVLVQGKPEEDSFDYDPFVKFDKRRSVLLVPGEPAFEQDPFEKFDKRRSVLVQGEPEEDSFDYDPFVKFDKRSLIKGGLFKFKHVDFEEYDKASKGLPDAFEDDPFWLQMLHVVNKWFNVLLKYHDGIGVQTLVGGTRFKVDQQRLETDPCQIIIATHIENKSGFSARLMKLK